MNRYYAVIAETMMHSEGDVSEFCGPTIVAHFGLHRQVKDVTMMLGAVSREFRAAAASLESEFGVHVGMGICRGIVIYGNFGSSNRIAYTAFGPPIHCAERSATRNGSVNVCEPLARSVSFAGLRADPEISVHPHWEPR
jgi:class 3 adenylate cyclase